MLLKGSVWFTLGTVATAQARRHRHLERRYERVARGRAARGVAPRSSPRSWEPAADRPDPVALLEEQAATASRARSDPAWRMLVSPFAFFRGAALIMAADLADDSRVRASTSSSAVTRTCRTSVSSPRPSARCCSTSTTSTRPCPGPWEWDVKRLAASFEVAGRHRGFDHADRRAIVRRLRRRVPRGDAADRWLPRRLDALVRPPRFRSPRWRRPRRGAGEPPRHGAGEAGRGGRSRRRGAGTTLACFAKLADEHRRRTSDRRGPAADRADRGPDAARDAGREESTSRTCGTLLREYRRSLARRPPPDGGVPLRPHGAQGRRRRQRRHARVDPPAASAATTTTRCSSRRSRRRRPCSSASSAGAASRTTAAGRRGPAAHAGRERHLPRLAAREGARRHRARLLRAPAARLEGRRRRRDHARCPARRSTRACAARRLARAHARWGDRIAIASTSARAATFDRAIADFAVLPTRTNRSSNPSH